MRNSASRFQLTMLGRVQFQLIEGVATSARNSGER
jgi:hypothetical protein